MSNTDRFAQAVGVKQLHRDLLTVLTITTSIEPVRDRPVEMRYAETIRERDRRDHRS